MDYYTKHLLHQQRLRFEDSRIRIHDQFRPDPRAVSLTWKFYSRYRDRCDLCRVPGHPNASSDNDNNHNNGDNAAWRLRDGGAICPCSASDYDRQQCSGEDGDGGEFGGDPETNSPLDKMSQHMKLVDDAILSGPHEKYGRLPEPPLTSHVYGWLPADTYTGKYDLTDWQRFYHPRRKANFWY